MNRLFRRKIRLEIIGVILSIIILIGIINADKVRIFLYEKDRYATLDNFFPIERSVNISDDGRLLGIYDGFSLLVRKNVEDEILAVPEEDRGNVSYINFTSNNKYLYYLKDEFNGRYKLKSISIEDKIINTISKGEYSNEKNNIQNIDGTSKIIYGQYEGEDDNFPDYYLCDLETNKTKNIFSNTKFSDVYFDNELKPVFAVRNGSVKIEYYIHNKNWMKIGEIEKKDLGKFIFKNNYAYVSYITKKDDSYNLNIINLETKKIKSIIVNNYKNIENFVIKNGDLLGAKYFEDSKIKMTNSTKSLYDFNTAKNINLLKVSSQANVILAKSNTLDNQGKIFEINNSKYFTIIDEDSTLNLNKIYTSKIIENRNGIDYKETDVNKKYENENIVITIDGNLNKNSNINQYDPLIQAISDRGNKTFNINISEMVLKNISEQEIDKEIVDVINKIRKTNIKKNLYIIGRGYGGDIALNILNKTNAKGFIMIEPEIDFHSIRTNTSYGKIVKSNLERNFHDSLFNLEIQKINIPVGIYFNQDYKDSQIIDEFATMLDESSKDVGVFGTDKWHEIKLGSIYFFIDYFYKYME